MPGSGKYRGSLWRVLPTPNLKEWLSRWLGVRLRRAVYTEVYVSYIMQNHHSRTAQVGTSCLDCSVVS